MKNLSSGVYIDTTTRKLRCYAVSVTETDMGLVIRNAAELPHLPQEAVPFVLVDERGYEARSSCGFVTVVTAATQRKLVCGACGFPWAPGLRPIARYPVSVVPDARIRVLRTHKNYSPDCAEAAREILPLAVRPSDVLIMEGQSNWTTALYIEPRAQEKISFPPEHRKEMFTAINVAKAGLRYALRHIDPAKRDGHVFILAALLALGTERVPWAPVIDKSVAQAICDQFFAAGWRLGIDTQQANHFAQAITPDGEVITGGSLVKLEPEVETGFAAMCGMSDINIATGEDRAWLAHVCL